MELGYNHSSSLLSLASNNDLSSSSTTLIWLLLASWLSATLSGAAGFGGALILLPVLSNTVGTKAAVPLLTIGQLLGNLSRAWFGRTEIQWKLSFRFILGAVPLSVVGSRLFVGLPTKLISKGIGILLLVIVVLRRTGTTNRFDVGEKGLFWGGALTGLLSGLAGSAGPLGAAFFLGLDLAPGSYVASEAVTAVAMHVTKTLVYQRYSLVHSREVAVGLLMGAGMSLGSWTGKKIIERIPKDKFVCFVEILLVLVALQLIVSS